MPRSWRNPEVPPDSGWEVGIQGRLPGGNNFVAESKKMRRV
jgi:hypothetical protein